MSVLGSDIGISHLTGWVRGTKIMTYFEREIQIDINYIAGESASRSEYF